jgi:(p)ppGpp synthase/HD superfamily hydrolase
MSLAQQFAEAKHAGKQRRGGRSAITHPAAVAEAVSAMGPFAQSVA